MCILVNIPAYGIANKNFLLPFILIALGMLFYNKLYKQYCNKNNLIRTLREITS